ncbi:MAG TPA: hypothetical protein VGX24_06090 [Pyrinomonadaceae bacterium]|jgi:hypothetical protein|nr:hypothetical protein [Pyrinomonadaceae bacterium]
MNKWINLLLMLKTIHIVCTCLIIALGVLHLLFTFHDYDEFTLGALWFASAGVAIIFAGFLNLISIRLAGRDALARTLCFVSNLVLTALFVAALWLMRQPQVFAGALLFAVASVASVASRGLRASGD